MVIKVLPWVAGAPFPTMYWLTCPLLKKELSHLEKDGVIKNIELEYLNDLEVLRSLNENHKDYRDERIKLFESTIKDWNLLPTAQQEILKTTGIGGISDFDHIKCLHLQYAYHLASLDLGGRVIGSFIDQQFPQVPKTYR